MNIRDPIGSEKSWYGRSSVGGNERQTYIYDSRINWATCQMNEKVNMKDSDSDISKERLVAKTPDT